MLHFTTGAFSFGPQLFNLWQRLSPREVHLRQSPLWQSTTNGKEMGPGHGHARHSRSNITNRCLIRRAQSALTSSCRIRIRKSPERGIAHLDLDPTLLEGIAALPTYDAELARAIADAPVVLAMVSTPEAFGPTVLSDTTVSVTVGSTLVHEAPNIEDVFQRRRYHESPAIRERRRRSRCCVDPVDRRCSAGLTVGFQNRRSLGPEHGAVRVRVAQRAQSSRLITDGISVKGVWVGKDFFATDASGGIYTVFSRQDPARFVSAVDVLRNSIDVTRLHRGLVLIGDMRTGAGNLRYTPTGESMSGLETLAQLIENLIEKSYLTRPNEASTVESVMTVIAGGAVYTFFPATHFNMCASRRRHRSGACNRVVPAVP